MKRGSVAIKMTQYNICLCRLKNFIYSTSNGKDAMQTSMPQFRVLTMFNVEL